MIPRDPNERSPILLRPRGERFCESCAEVTAHRAARKLSPLGRGLIVFAAAVTIVLYAHNAWRFEPGGLGYAVIYWSLPAVVGVILVVLGLKRRGFVVRCERCARATFRLSPPRWTSNPHRDRERP